MGSRDTICVDVSLLDGGRSVKLAMKSTGNVVSEGGTDNLCYASEPVIIHSLFVKGNRVWISV